MKAVKSITLGAVVFFTILLLPQVGFFVLGVTFSPGEFGAGVIVSIAIAMALLIACP